MHFRFDLMVIFSVAGAILLLGCNNQRGATSSSSPEPLAASGLFCTERQWDLGEVLVKGKSMDFDHTFHLQNNSAETVKIRDIRSDCGCLVTKGYSPTIEPGERTEIKVRISVFGAPGPFRKTITVLEDSASNRELPLVVLGRRAISDLLYVTPREVNFGTLKRGESVVRRVTLSRYDGSTVNFRELLSKDSGIRLDGEPLSVIRYDSALNKDCECVELPVRFDVESQPVGLFESKITFRTLSPDSSTADLDVAVEAQISVAPSPWVETVFAKRLERGATVEHSLVSPEESLSLPEILSASFEGSDSITVELVRVDGNEKSAALPRIRIGRPQDSQVFGVARGTLSLWTTLSKGQPVAKIEVEAFLPK